MEFADLLYMFFFLRHLQSQPPVKKTFNSAMNVISTDLFSGCSERLEIGEAFHWRLEDFQGSIQLSKEYLRKKSTGRLSN